MNDPIPNWPNSFEPQHRMPPPTNRAHDDSSCVDTSITPQGPSGDGLTEGLLMIVTDAVGLPVAVAVDVEVTVWVRVAVEARVAEIVTVAVNDPVRLEEGVVDGVGALDGVTVEVKEIVGDGEALATVSSYSEVPKPVVAVKYTCRKCTHVNTHAHIKTSDPVKA
jgi:hypothetical protein